ncbi:MAG: DUF6958 family protein [Arenicella sp.]
MTEKTKMIEVENVNVSGLVSNVNAEKYNDMKTALLAILPESSPGLTHKDIMEKTLPHLSETLFPKGAKRGWWSKTVQLDLEAKKIITREQTKPLRWHKTHSK